mgnify:CR=1 FL=1
MTPEQFKFIQEYNININFENKDESWMTISVWNKLLENKQWAFYRQEFTWNNHEDYIDFIQKWLDRYKNMSLYFNYK